jgi:hypothetical protein
VVAETLSVPSSNIAKVSYDSTSQDLTVEFQDLQVYRYLSVPQMVFDDMKRMIQQGGSVGSYFYRHVRSVYANIAE